MKGFGYRALWSIAGLLLLLSCGSTAFDTRWEAARETIASARENGAQKCAPVELAMAESHHDFAMVEHREGDYFRAKEELSTAEKNAARALELSPKGKCTDAPPIVPPTDDDRDGDGIKNDDDECPDKAEDMDGFEDEDGCPETDNDGDGMVDSIDECPNEAEDKDGFQDEDGCPDDDNDSDGMADSVDTCPDQPEDKDGFEDDDGCPDCDNDGDGVPECPKVVDLCPDKPAQTPDGCPKYKNVVVTDKKIEIKQTIYFDTNKATIKPKSYGILDEVAAALKDNKTIKIRIEGHTDSRGSDARNKKLSQARAQSVQTYLEGQGIAASRMSAKGYGESVPIADNRTTLGRDQNRRVEFVITDR